MRIAVIVLAAVAVGVWLVSLIVSRFDEGLREPLKVGSAFVMRACMCAATLLLALRAAMRGGYGWVEFAGFMIVSVWFFFITAALVWGGKSGEEDGD